MGMDMTMSAQLNIGNMGGTPTATRARAELPADTDAASPGGRSEERGKSFDSAMQKATQRTESRSNDHGPKRAEGADDVAGRGEELPGDEIAQKDTGQSSADAGDKKAATDQVDQNEHEDVAAAEPDAAAVQGSKPEITTLVGTGVQGGVAVEEALSAVASSDSKTIGIAGAVRASVSKNMDPALSVGSQSGVSGKEGVEASGVQGLMSFRRLGGDGGTTGDQTKIALNQILSGAEQAAGVAGARAEGASGASLAAASNVVNSLSAPQAQAGLLNATSPPPGTVATPQVATPFGNGQWANDVGQQLQWMVSQNVQRADLKLNPAHLGPIEVRIVMHHDQVQVSMNATHAQVRDALESAMPRLREGLESGGFGQASVDVGQQSFGDARAEGDNDLQDSSRMSEAEEELMAASTTTLSGVRAAGIGLVDHFA